MPTRITRKHCSCAARSDGLSTEKATRLAHRERMVPVLFATTQGSAALVHAGIVAPKRLDRLVADAIGAPARPTATSLATPQMPWRLRK
jgi:hypothetical protein